MKLNDKIQIKFFKQFLNKNFLINFQLINLKFF